MQLFCILELVKVVGHQDLGGACQQRCSCGAGPPMMHHSSAGRQQQTVRRWVRPETEAGFQIRRELVTRMLQGSPCACQYKRRPASSSSSMKDRGMQVVSGQAVKQAGVHTHNPGMKGSNMH